MRDRKMRQQNAEVEYAGLEIVRPKCGVENKCRNASQESSVHIGTMKQNTPGTKRIQA